MPPLASAGLFANETEWRFPAPLFFVLTGQPEIFIESLGRLTDPDDERKKI